MSWFLLDRNLKLLEPYDWKLSRTVLRGERGSNAPDLPGSSTGKGITTYQTVRTSDLEVIDILAYRLPELFRTCYPTC